MTTDTKKERNLSDMTLKELKELRKEWYKQAVDDGSIARCYKVCTIIGELFDPEYGPKYRLLNVKNGLDLYHYGNYIIATWKGKQVMSTHPCERLFIPGNWMKIVDELYMVAVEKQRQEKERQDNQRRQELQAKLII